MTSKASIVDKLVQDGREMHRLLSLMINEVQYHADFAAGPPNPSWHQLLMSIDSLMGIYSEIFAIVDRRDSAAFGRLALYHTTNSEGEAQQHMLGSQLAFGLDKADQTTLKLKKELLDKERSADEPAVAAAPRDIPQAVAIYNAKCDALSQCVKQLTHDWEKLLETLQPSGALRKKEPVENLGETHQRVLAEFFDLLN